MKDIFIDTDVTGKFTNPVSPAYKNLYRWLFDCNEAYLVVSNKILGEYGRSFRHCISGTNFAVIIDKITRDKRFNKFTNREIRDFRSRNSRNFRGLHSNDPDHLAVVLMSDRKYALTLDDNFVYDLENFPGFTVLVKKSPKDLPYK